MQKRFLLLLYVLMPPPVFGASLPSTGYVAPYEADYSDYGDLPEAVYDESAVSFDMHAGGSGFQVADEGGTDEENMAYYDVCSDESGTVFVHYCPDCISAAELDAYDCNLDAIFSFLGSAGYQACLYNKCGQHLGQEPAPIGAETPLFAFALSYLVLRMYSHKKRREKT